MWLTSPQPRRLGSLPSALWSTKPSLEQAGSRGVPGRCLQCSPEIQEIDVCVERRRSCTHQPRGDFPPLAQLRQGRQTDVIWKQKNKISGEGRTPEAHLGRKRAQAKGAWERQKDWEKGRSRGRSWHPLGESSGEKTAPRVHAAEGRSLALAGKAGMNGPGSPESPANDHSVQVRPHAAHGRSAHRRVRVATLSAPPPHPSPSRKTPPGPAQEGQGSAALEPAGAALAPWSPRQCV